MIWTVTIPRVPPSLNELKRKYRNPHVYKQLRDTWEWEWNANLPKRLKPCFFEAKEVRVSITAYRKRRLDYDNLVGSLKVVMDAAQRAQVLKTDSFTYLSFTEINQVTHKKQQLTIKLEAIGGPKPKQDYAARNNQ